MTSYNGFDLFFFIYSGSINIKLINNQISLYNYTINDKSDFN